MKPKNFPHYWVYKVPKWMPVYYEWRVVYASNDEEGNIRTVYMAHSAQECWDALVREVK
jgi:hypothetical protein